MNRPARVQVNPDDIPDDDKPPQTGHTFNIWYLQWAGGDRSSNVTQRLKTRVKILEDSGYTRAKDGKLPLCLFFARGCCYKGKSCQFLHRLPLPTDPAIPSQDCFGRDKTADYKDNMGGVGLFNKVNKTLYAAGLHVNDEIEETLANQFREFGSIDKIRVLRSKACAFISFKYELEAQFAKEAMDGQTLDGNDTLTVRWANDDPNPNAQQLAKRSADDAALDTVKRLLAEEPKKRKTQPSPKKKPSKEEPVPSEKEEIVEEEIVEEEPANSRRLLGTARLAALGKLQKSGKPNSAEGSSNGGNDANTSNAPPSNPPPSNGTSSNGAPSIKPDLDSPVQATSASQSHFGGYASSDED